MKKTATDLFKMCYLFKMCCVFDFKISPSYGKYVMPHQSMQKFA